MQTNKLREALTKILNLTNSLDENCAVDPVEIRDIAKAALAEPVRNYEVGTAEEQAERFTKVCTANSKDGVRGLCSETCPFSRDYQGECALVWSQMPYEEGGAK